MSCVVMPQMFLLSVINFDVTSCTSVLLVLEPVRTFNRLWNKSRWLSDAAMWLAVSWFDCCKHTTGLNSWFWQWQPSLRVYRQTTASVSGTSVPRSRSVVLAKDGLVSRLATVFVRDVRRARDRCSIHFQIYRSLPTHMQSKCRLKVDVESF